jgi:aspartyl aminopeptidase
LSSSRFNKELLQFLQQSPTPFHANANMVSMLEQAGFTRLDETAAWQLEKKHGYYVCRNDSALVAFKTGSSDLLENGMRLAGTHTDSPCLKIKPNPVIRNNGYVQLGVEVYGGALFAPWFDRDLSIAGRVDFQDRQGRLRSTLIDLSEPIATIPSLAIHLDRLVNEGRPTNAQQELVPILMQLDEQESFNFDDFLLSSIKQVGASKSAKKVLAHELMLYDTQAPSLLGLQKQFIASARLDNLLSCFLACKSLIASKQIHASALVCNDHEEVGSVSTSGAQGPFLKSVLQRWVRALDTSADAMERIISKSMLFSIDNAHGVHPNYADKHDAQHKPLLNGGPVIKINANQRYASNSQSIALFKSICDKVKVPYQSFVMRSDMACGSTIGPITASGLGIATIDIGIASFAMHSIRELAGADDAVALSKVVTAYYNR